VNSACSAISWGRYFCSTAGAIACNGDQTAYAYCDFSTYTSALPLGMQYFSNPNEGGTDGYGDYCPVYQGYENTYCQDIVSGNSFLGNNPLPLYGMYFSPSSACFEFTWVSDGSGAAACYQMSCITSNSGQILQVNVYGVIVNCTQPRTVQIGIYNEYGNIQSANFVCPSVDFFCGPNTQLQAFPPLSPSEFRITSSYAFKFVPNLVVLLGLFFVH